jgi:hypothetical protein
MPIGAFDGTNPVAAGWYYATMSTTSVGQLYNVIYNPILPTGLTSANYPTTTSARWLTQTTGADIAFLDIGIPGGILGTNGAIYVDKMLSINSSANNKIIKCILNTTTLMSTTATTSTTLLSRNLTMNRGAANSQVSEGSAGFGVSSVALTWAAVDTSVFQQYIISGQLAANTDFIVLEGELTRLYPGIN